jgi:transposase InsO family protein
MCRGSIYVLPSLILNPPQSTLSTHTSPYAIACVIGQLDDTTGLGEDQGVGERQEVGPERRMREAHPIVFLSRVLDDTQTRWSQPEKEAYAVYWFITENRSLLLGSRIWVYCDCKPVTEAFRMASVNNKINRWVLKVQEYDFEIFHVPGKMNILADSLSRVPRDLLLSMEAEERRLVEEFHRRDEGGGGDKGKERVRAKVGAISLDMWKKWRSGLVRYLATGSYHQDLLEGERARIRKMSRDYKLEEIVGREDGSKEAHKVPLRLVYLNRLGTYVPVPKASEIPNILKAFHDDACAGHYAFEITYRRIYAVFFWPTLRQDAFEYTRSCDACQKCKDLSEYKTEPLRPIIVMDPFDLVTVDYSGPHNPSGPGGNTYMLLAVDYMTGWLEIMTFREATGASTVRGMARFCLRYGYPKVLHSDHDPHFDNLEVKNWAKGKGIKWVFGSPGTAKGQGKAERAIRCIKASMRKLMLDAPKRWYDLVPSVQLAFNCRYVYAGDLSPAMLLLGYQPRLPIQNLVQGLDIDTRSSESDQSPKVEEVSSLRLARLDAWRMEAVDRHLVRWKQRIEGLERGLHKHVYRIGDWVLYQNYQLNTRAGAPWDQRWRGPVRIVHISRKGKVDLYHPTADFYLRGWHTDRIRPYHLRDE